MNSSLIASVEIDRVFVVEPASSTYAVAYVPLHVIQVVTECSYFTALVTPRTAKRPFRRLTDDRHLESSWANREVDVVVSIVVVLGSSSPQ